MKNESGRSMIEMLIVLALIGILSVGAIKSYQSGQNQNEVNKITELASIASLNSLTKVKRLFDSSEPNVWKVIGKKKADYKCINSLDAFANGSVEIEFNKNCNDIQKMVISQWGSHAKGSGNTYTYYPPKDDE